MQENTWNRLYNASTGFNWNGLRLAMYLCELNAWAGKRVKM